MKDNKNKERNVDTVVRLICVAIFLVIIAVAILLVSCDKNEDNGDKNPTTTETPTITSKNEVTNTPVPTETVEPTENPERTPTPVPTDVVDVTETPTPEPTVTESATPTETPKPTATDKPDPTEAPKPTSTPKPTATPTTSAGKEILLNVVAEGQGTNFESGSGIMAASMVLKYYGVNVDTWDMYLCIEIVDYQSKDVTPWEYCIGAPDTMSALYYAPVIKNMMNTYLSKIGVTDIKAKDITGCTPNDIYNYVLNGDPVIVVANMSMFPWAEEGTSWTLPSGETFTWKSKTCFFVVTGVDNENVTVINGTTGTILEYNRSMFEESFTAYESQAIIIE